MRALSVASGLVVVFGLLALSSCTPAEGGDGQACYPNSTCNAGLSCVASVCVATVDSGSTGGGAGGGTMGGGSGGGGGAIDAGNGDAGNGDAGEVDAGPGDAGNVDAGDVDAGTGDAGLPDAGCATSAATCGAPADCAPTGTSCLVSTCTTACCGTVPAASGTTCTDLGGRVCDGQGHCQQCLAPVDCPASPTVCQVNTCTAGTCGHANAPLGTSCMDNGGVVCDGAGTCTAAHCMDGIRDADESDKDCGGSSCMPCSIGHQCVAPRDCQTAACSGGVCQAPSCSDMVRNGTETDIDCGGGVCPACAVSKGCLVNGDCVSSACDAIKLTCAADQCLDHHRDGLETDVDCGGGVCPACAVGQVCAIDPDCTTSGCDAVSLICIANQCADHRKDGSETDVDCGGPTCAKCATGKGCAQNSDCVANACDLVSQSCVASQCADQRVDGAETDVDCGGGTCASCAVGQKCLVDPDCSSNACDGVTLTCVSSQCFDHRRDGVETDVDCGGGVCPICATGSKCTIDSDCATNACDATSLTCVSNQCADHRVDGTETDVDCGGTNACSRCLVGQKCLVNSDCQAGHTCGIGTRTCQ